MKTFGTVRQKNFDKNHDVLSYAQNFSIPATFRNTEVFPYELFATVDKSLFMENHDILVSHSFNVPQTDFVLADRKFSTTFCDTI